MKTLIFIPAYNEEENIERVVGNLVEKYPQYDYVVINDGSRDRTAQICREKGYHLIDLPVNLGLSGAFQTGMRYALENGYDAAVQFDADGQHLPEYIEPMEKKLAEGYDIVIGSRFVTKKKPNSMRMLGSTLITAAIRLTTGKVLRDPTSGMRMYSRRVIKEFAYQINFDPEPDTISTLMAHGAKVAEIQAEMAERIAGKSYLNFTRSIHYMMRVVFSIVFVQWFRKGMKFTWEEETVCQSN